jgi:hypothetical protein
MPYDLRPIPRRLSGAHDHHQKGDSTVHRLLLAAGFALATAAVHAVDLTHTELRWLSAGWPVITWAKSQGLPLDIVVQPTAKPGDPPLAMGYDDGRCTLVLSMRGNPDADTALEGIDPALLPTVVETMFAHEVGHCWRYVHGQWHALPAGFHDVAEAAGDPVFVEERRSMRDTRREEGYADLVGLAWTLTRHPERYAQLQAWLEAYRADQPVDGAHHDTRVWVKLARDPRVFGDDGTTFERAEAAWRKGLLAGD